jgi:hypothetical protein
MVPDRLSRGSESVVNDYESLIEGTEGSYTVDLGTRSAKEIRAEPSALC